MDFTVSVIIAAAGKGTRAAQEINKVYMDLSGKSVLVRSIHTFCQLHYVKSIIISIAEYDVTLFEKVVLKDELLLNHKDKIKVVLGGNTRQESVYNGLCRIDDTVDLIAVHDGARPLVQLKDIRAVMQKAYQSGAACLGVQVKDTIKRINADSQEIMDTPNRDELVSVQTPQVFKRDILCKAYQNALLMGIVGTDESTLVEKAGYPVYIVKGSYDNIKLTTPEDFYIAERLLGAKSR